MKTLNARSLLVVAAVLSGCPAPVKPVPPPAAPVITRFSATPATLQNPGETVTLSWSSTDATNVSIEQLGVGKLPVDATLAEGTFEVVVERNTVFVLTVHGPGGTDSRGAGVNVAPAATGPVFTATPAEVDSGQQATLVWNAPGAAEVSLRAVGGATIDVGTQREVGSVAVTPSSTTTYELTVDGRPLTTTVTVRPVIFDFALVGQVPLPGATLTLGWRTGGGESLTLTRRGTQAPLTTASGAQAAQGTFVDTAPNTLPRDGVLEYVLTLTQGTRTVTRELVVHLDGAVTIDAFIAPTYVRATDTFGASWRTTGATRVELRLQGSAYYNSPDLPTAANGGVTVPMMGTSMNLELIARNERGAEARQTRTVALVGAPTFNAFSASPAAIAQGGEPVVLSWDVTNARSVRIIGPGNEELHRVTGLVDTGTFTVYPNSPSVVYELRADNSAGDTVPAQQTTVTVASLARLTFSNLGPVGSVTQVTGTTVAGTGALSGLPTVQQNVVSDGFFDISTSGTSIAYVGPDTTARLVTLPETFTTTLFGQRVSGSSLSISINGWFVFSSTAIAGTDDNAPFPSTGLEPLAIAPYWEDLVDTADSEIYYQLDGTGPNRRLIVQWNEVEHDLYPASKLTFQAQVFASGKVVFAYSRFEGVTVNAPSVGIVTPGETSALTPSALPDVNTSFTFFAPQAPPVSVVIDGQPMRARAVLGSSFIDVSGNPFSAGILPDGGVAVCGNSAVEPGESCDDGATADGDGCSALCASETGYQCLGEPSLCRPRCGDGVIIAPETCDDVDSDPNDGCSTACTVETGYVCNGAPSLCAPICGDGIVSGGEACDDRGVAPNDGCSSTCSIEPGYDCSGAPSFCGLVGRVTSLGLSGTSATSGHTCVSTSSGQVFCSGIASSGQLGEGTIGPATGLYFALHRVPGLDDVSEVAVGSNFSCALRDGGVVSCWGDNIGLQLGNGGTSTTDVPTPANVVALTGAVDVEAGDLFACARLGAGTVSCWGDNASLQLGLGVAGTTDRSTPSPVVNLTNVTGLAVGGAHACAVIGDGGLRCWGENGSGQIGLGGTSTTDVNTPTSPAGLPAVSQACAGDAFTCAVTAGANPALYCWGINTNGQLGNGTTTLSRSPVLMAGVRPVSVSCGEQHVCIVEAGGAISCWGQNTTGQLGNGVVSTRSLTPVAALAPPNPIELRLGYANTCALYSDGSRLCWGHNENGQLGLGTPRLRPEPQLVPLANVAQVESAKGAYRLGHACARTTSNDLHCFGDNDWGQLGDGTLVPRSQPTLVTSLAGAVRDVAVTRFTSSANVLTTGATTCAVLVDGGVQCWGANNENQLGVGAATTTPQQTPIAASVSVPATSITAGGEFFCTTHTDDEVRCWGNNSSTQLSLPTGNRLTPTVVPGLTGAVQVVAGQDHLCARLATGEVACLGENDQGQLGVNSTTDSNVATLVPNLSGVEQLCSGADHVCALLTDGTVQCWGNNLYGQLGNGSFPTDVRVPAPVSGLTGVTQLACGGNYVCAVVSGGAVKCFGYGEETQLGNRNILNEVPLPSPMIGFPPAAAVSAGNAVTYVIGTDGALRSVGFVGSGQLGAGETSRPATPTAGQPF